jgi:hypothetical protein
MVNSETFTCHKQICAYEDLVDVKWRLELLANSEFNYLVKVKDTWERSYRKSSSLQITGGWQHSGDTVKLFANSVKGLCRNPLLFIRRGDTLQSLGNCFDEFSLTNTVKMTYLVKKKNK